jgi:hypothetical protein
MLVRERFKRQVLDEDYEKADIVNVRLNREERMMLDALKLCYNESSDSTVLKKEAFRVLKQARAFDGLLRK